MRFSVRLTSTGKLEAIDIEHRNQRSRWVAKASFNKSNFTSLPTLYDNVNQYLTKLPAQQQDDLWDCYEKIREALDSISCQNRLQKELLHLVSRLYFKFGLANFHTWVNYSASIVCPPDIKEHCTAPDEKTQAMTYTKSDFYGVARLAESLRLMLPVWSEYFGLKPVGNNSRLKDHLAYNLLLKTDIVHSEEINRLKVYIAAKLKTTESLPALVIHGGIGTEEFPGWVLSCTVLRRIAVGEVSIADNNLISKFCRYIKDMCEKPGMSFNVNVRAKQKPDWDEEDKSSLAENYKERQEFSDMDIIVNQQYLNNPHAVALAIDPTVDVSKVDEALNIPGGDAKIHDLQFQIAALIIKRVISIHMLDKIDYLSAKNVMAICYAILYHWDFIGIGLILLAEVREDVSGDMSDGLQTIDSATKLAKESVAQLIERYPHYYRSGRSQEQTRNDNIAVKWIDDLTSGLNKYTWVFRTPSEYSQYHGSILEIPHDLKESLFKLILKSQFNQ